DQIILARITNDERPLRRVIKKLYNYTALAHPPIVPQIPAPGSSTPAPSADDAREAFLVELASFRLMLRKSVMICEAEARQVEEYQREKERIDLEHGTLRGRIEQLKTGLEHEQMLRRRKIEYDFVAEKVNSLPSREELELSIQALENDMSTIRAEHEAQDRSILAQTISLDQIIKNLEALRSLGRGDQEIAAGADMTPRDSPGPEGSGDAPTAVPEVETAVPEKMEVEEGEEESVGPSKEDGEGDDDIEMGEVEEPKKGKKKREEELEEGEASDGSDLSSVLSDVPD
ncbi:Tho complex subunit 7-domain-containing protein, partial [Mycena amicta]